MWADQKDYTSLLKQNVNIGQARATSSKQPQVAQTVATTKHPDVPTANEWYREHFRRHWSNVSAQPQTFQQPVARLQWLARLWTCSCSLSKRCQRKKEEQFCFQVFRSEDPNTHAHELEKATRTHAFQRIDARRACTHSCLCSAALLFVQTIWHLSSAHWFLTGRWPCHWNTLVRFLHWANGTEHTFISLLRFAHKGRHTHTHNFSHSEKMYDAVV